MKAEKIPYTRSTDGDRSLTPCPHGGSWWARESFLQINPVGKRVPAMVGTNACHDCIFNKGVEWDHVKCLFLKASQRFVNRELKRER